MTIMLDITLSKSGFILKFYTIHGFGGIVVSASNCHAEVVSSIPAQKQLCAGTWMFVWVKIYTIKG